MARARRPVDLDALTDLAVALTHEHGAVPRASMKAFRPHLAALRPRLEAQGIEIASTIRRPLGAQLRALAERAPIAVKGIERAVAGATAREIKDASKGLVARGELLLVVRESGPAFVARSAAALEPDDIETLERIAARLQKLLKATHAKKGGGQPTLLRADVESLLALFAASDSQAAEAVTAPRSQSTTLAEEIARRLGGTTLPTRVPDLLRALGVEPEVGKVALLDGASRGLFELEPESGMARLSREDADLCPPGPMGTRLSWVRVRGTNGAR